MKLLLIFGIVLCKILQSNTQTHSEQTLEITHPPSEHQKRVITNKTKFATDISHRPSGEEADPRVEPFEYRKGTVTNVTKLHHFSIFRTFFPSLFSLFSPHRWIHSYSFGNSTQNNGSEEESIDQDSTKIQPTTVSTDMISKELYTETSHGPSEHQNGTVTNVTKQHHHLFIFRTFFPSLFSIFSPHHWIHSYPLRNGLRNNSDEEISTDHDSSTAQATTAPNSAKLNTSLMSRVKLGKTKRSNSSYFQADGHSLNSPFHLWFARVVESANLEENEIATTTGTKTTATETSSPRVLTATGKKMAQVNSFRRFDHVREVSCKSVLYFIFKVVICSLAIIWLVLLFLHSLCWSKKDTTTMKRKGEQKNSAMGHYFIV